MSDTDSKKSDLQVLAENQARIVAGLQSEVLTLLNRGSLQAKDYVAPLAVAIDKLATLNGLNHN